jgi:hypothetical protein
LLPIYMQINLAPECKTKGYAPLAARFETSARVNLDGMPRPMLFSLHPSSALSPSLASTQPALFGVSRLTLPRTLPQHLGPTTAISYRNNAVEVSPPFRRATHRASFYGSELWCGALMAQSLRKDIIYLRERCSTAFAPRGFPLAM